MARFQKKVVGSQQRADADIASVQQGWQTDKLSGEDPNFRYQFMKKDEVHDRERGKVVMNRYTGKPVRVSGWTVVMDGEVEMLGQRPDVANPVDTICTMGPHVLMKIPKDDHEMLLHEKDAVPDAMEARLMRGGIKDNIEGVAVVAESSFAPHPSLMGKQGEGNYSPAENKLMGKFQGTQ